MRCVQINGSGAVVDVVPQPVDLSTCSLVISSGAEVVGSPFALTLSDASSLAVAIGLLWAVAWVFRVLSRQLWES